MLKNIIFICSFLMSSCIAFAQLDTVIVYVDTVNYEVDSLDASLYYVPVKAINMVDVAAFDITISVDDSAEMDEEYYVLENIPVGGTTIDETDYVTSTRVLFFDLVGMPLTVDDDATLFYMAVRFDGGLGDCISFTIDQLEVVDAEDPAFLRPAEGVGGEMCLPETADIYGTITNPDLIALDSVLVELVQGDSVMITYTDTLGQYSFGDVQIGVDAVITPMAKVNEDTRAERINGINIVDLVVMVRHILGVNPLTDVYSILAGDVNTSGSFTILDVREVHKYILNIQDTYPDSEYYKFHVKEVEFIDPLNPFEELTESILITPTTVEVNDVDFIGIRMGDVQR